MEFDFDLCFWNWCRDKERQCIFQNKVSQVQPWHMTQVYHKITMQQIKNENHVRSFTYRFVHFTHVENMFDTWINVVTNEMWTYKWANITWSLHFYINSRVKYVFNAPYQCVKNTNYEWTNFARSPLLNCEMLNLWCYVFYYVLKLSLLMMYYNNLKWDPNFHSLVYLCVFMACSGPHKTTCVNDLLTF